ncbi:MAG: hypothetical protein M0R37_01380 [Bacteroidales bacterium]|nr:hypothetical protein [Bacteroidales bacterium]
MEQNGFLEQIPAAAISGACGNDGIAVIINVTGHNNIFHAMEELKPQSNYKIYYTEPGIDQLKEVMEQCHESGLKSIVLFGNKRPDIESLEPEGSVALISAGSGTSEDNLLLSILDYSRIKGFAHIGYQTYRYNPELLQRTRTRSFEELRLGLIREDITLAEPAIRNSEYIFTDINSVRVCDFPDSVTKSPNGLYAEELCQLGRYIGMSLALKTLFVYGFPSDLKQDSTGGQLVAEFLWHFAEGLISNVNENPANTDNEDFFLKKIVSMGQDGQDLVFVTSRSSGRWWIEIPNIKSRDNLYVACSYSDYATACSGEIPLRWLYFYQKVNSD